ncbi:MAG: hypothetical protein KDJ80_06995 [Nitratireductor sp.]|nr:hypothetical protein [Nitratireductor sp.]
MTHSTYRLKAAASVLALGAATLLPATAQADLTVYNSLCVGFDCGNPEPGFGADTIRLKENNLRIHFDDTSTAGSFPRNDWRILVNDQANGGLSRFSVQDATANRIPFTIEAGAVSNALYVDDGGRVGFNTSTPVLELHTRNGDSPGLRLEQDGSSGFAPQTWDLAGNETSFFLRDATHGSTLPLRVFPGAPSNSLIIEGSTGHIGLGTISPSALLHLSRGGAGNDGLPRIMFDNTDGSENWTVDASDNDDFRISVDGSGQQEFVLSSAGNLTITGGLVTTGGGGACTPADPCDAVFDPAIYTVPSIDDHAAQMWANKYLPAVGPTRPDEPLDVTLKLVRMLNELEHAHIYIEQLHNQLKEQKVMFEARLAVLEEKASN